MPFSVGPPPPRTKNFFNYYSRKTLPPDLPHVLQYEEELHNIIYIHQHTSKIFSWSLTSSPSPPPVCRRVCPLSLPSYPHPCTSSSDYYRSFPSSLHNEFRLLKGFTFQWSLCWSVGCARWWGKGRNFSGDRISYILSIFSVIGIISWQKTYFLGSFLHTRKNVKNYLIRAWNRVQSHQESHLGQSSCFHASVLQVWGWSDE